MGLENFNGLPIRLEGLQERFSADMEIRAGMVRLGGNQQDLEKYKPPLDSFLIADCSGITQPGTYILPVSVHIPSDFILLRQEPEKITVQIKDKDR